MSRAERKAATRVALIDAGERLVRKKGFGVSVEEIAAEAGFTKGAVYSNFASRAELIVEVGERVLPGLAVDVDTSAPSVLDALEATARQEVIVANLDREQIVLQLDLLVQMLRDGDLARALDRGEVGGQLSKIEATWDLPIPAAQWNIALNAVAIGLLAQRLLMGPEEVPDELFVWLNRRLAGDP